MINFKGRSLVIGRPSFRSEQLIRNIQDCGPIRESIEARAPFHQFQSHPRRPKVISPEGPGQCFHRVSMKRRTREAGGGHISSQSLPSMERKRRQLNISREPRTGRTDGRGTGVPSGNLRGIEDLVHSYPPTSRPRPAESSLGLTAPIPFLMTTFGLSVHAAVPCTHTYVHGPPLPSTPVSLPFTVPLVSATR